MKSQESLAQVQCLPTGKGGGYSLTTVVFFILLNKGNKKKNLQIFYLFPWTSNTLLTVALTPHLPNVETKQPPFYKNN